MLGTSRIGSGCRIDESPASNRETYSRLASVLDLSLLSELR
jgi:hypothetical protein